MLTSTEGQPDLPRYFAPAFARMKEGLVAGSCTIRLPDGRCFQLEGANPGRHAEITIHNDELFARLIREGDLGFCEAYMDGWWSTPDLQNFMDFIHESGDEVFDGFSARSLPALYERLRFWLQSNTKRQAKKNIAAHYDLGNEFYRLWLDETMTYSSAIFDESTQSLESAQRAKYASLVDQMGAQPGDHVLEIGCGWGGFAEYAAAERGLRVTGLTISRAQLAHAQARMQVAGLADRVTLKLQDYRDEAGVYDGIASIEMFEAVGERYWPTYWSTVRERLKPGAKGTFQIITIEDRRWEAYRRSVDFIQKYIFPGGMLPSPSALRDEIARAGLNVSGAITFGQSYNQTLRLWYDSFTARWDEIATLGFDERFRRLWSFYLTGCAATFRTGNCDVTQMTVSRPA
ncbi:SAM-dependent methyltransferase [Pseudoroseicyclus tamaricis]|uniref:Class I SAM-dependent methyltransferase n=1 Tax=Pseudoroseicyclus tamaricis TaxID=2705421 RepID=A0A6B2JPX9_9RHOB|nr:cyclopropane-fatty-acyl-phospholipid synthase family protein [Pseudoroseicyclus tamaricis]NDV00737.1 class I SAM-dependent methyltransferase [Pseudoroseicyclus tamaricis]